MTAGPVGVKDSGSGTSEVCDTSRSDLHNAGSESSSNNPQAVGNSNNSAETASGSKTSAMVMDTDDGALSVATPDALAPQFDWSPVNNTSAVRKKGWPRGRKRRCLPKDAPKAPLSGYMLYMGEQREQLRHSDTPPSFTELAKIVAHKWAALDSTEKQKYLDASDIEKERYQKALSAYVQTDAYKQFMEQQQLQQQQQPVPPPPASKLHQSHSKGSSEGSHSHTNGPVHDVTSYTHQQPDNKRQKREAPHTPALPLHNTNNTANGNIKVNGSLNTTDDDLISYNNNSPLEIPIFTDQFLKHNKAREAELRQLRKSNSDYEEQNALLQKHIQSIRLSVDKSDNETAEMRKKTVALKQHLSSLRADLARAFANMPAPGWTSPPTASNIDEYLMSLHAVLTASPPATQSRATQQAVQQLVTSLMLH